MAMETITVRATRDEVKKAIFSLPSIAGQSANDAAQGLMIRLGQTALYNIKKQFVVKANGGTDDCGLKWPPLEKSTVAYHRRHPGLPYPGSKRAPKAPSYALSAKQRKRWWELYNGFGGMKPKGSAYHSATNNYNDFAAAKAWIISKQEGATTILEKYGDVPHKILRDTDLLFNSLSPGVQSPLIVAVTNQVFRIGPGEVIVGTNRAHAKRHHEGKGVPQRRLWAPPEKWPTSWWAQLLNTLRSGLITITKVLLK